MKNGLSLIPKDIDVFFQDLSDKKEEDVCFYFINKTNYILDNHNHFFNLVNFIREHKLLSFLINFNNKDFKKYINQIKIYTPMIISHNNAIEVIQHIANFSLKKDYEFSLFILDNLLDILIKNIEINSFIDPQQSIILNSFSKVENLINSSAANKISLNTKFSTYKKLLQNSTKLHNFSNCEITIEVFFPTFTENNNMCESLNCLIKQSDNFYSNSHIGKFGTTIDISGESYIPNNYKELFNTYYNYKLTTENKKIIFPIIIFDSIDLQSNYNKIIKISESNNDFFILINNTAIFTEMLLKETLKYNKIDKSFIHTKEELVEFHGSTLHDLLSYSYKLHFLSEEEFKLFDYFLCNVGGNGLNLRNGIFHGFISVNKIEVEDRSVCELWLLFFCWFLNSKTDNNQFKFTIGL